MPKFKGEGKIRNYDIRYDTQLRLGRCGNLSDGDGLLRKEDAVKEKKDKTSEH